MRSIPSSSSCARTTAEDEHRHRRRPGLSCRVFFLVELERRPPVLGRRRGADARRPRADVTARQGRRRSLLTLEAEPLMAHAIRATTAKNSLGLRVVPARGTASSSGSCCPATAGIKPTIGSVRRPPAQARPSCRSPTRFAASRPAHPRPVFATARRRARRVCERARSTTVSRRDSATSSDGDRVGFDAHRSETVPIVVCTYRTSATPTPPRCDDRVLAGAERSPTGAAATRRPTQVALRGARARRATLHDEARGRQAVGRDRRAGDAPLRDDVGRLKASGPAGFTVERHDHAGRPGRSRRARTSRAACPSDAYALIIGESRRTTGTCCR